MEATTAMISTQIREVAITSWALHEHNFIFTYYSLKSFLWKSKLIENIFDYKYVAKTVSAYLDVMNFGR